MADPATSVPPPSSNARPTTPAIEPRYTRAQNLKVWFVFIAVPAFIVCVLVFHQSSNLHGWTKSDISGFVSKCEASGYNATPSYCRCVADHTAANVDQGTYAGQLESNSDAAVIDHDELTQGQGCQ